MGDKSWGPEIWEDKTRHHDEVGVILGTGHTKRDLERNTAKIVDIMKIHFLPEIPSGGKILDVGTGPAGRFAIILARLGYDVTALDGAVSTLEKAKRNAQSKGVPGIKFVQSDFTDFDLQDKFDAILCVETFFHLPAHLALPAFGSFNRNLKEGGVMCVHFAVLEEMTPGWLLKNLVYMTSYRLAKPLLGLLGRKSFFVTVTRNTDSEIEDIARLTGFSVTRRIGDFYFFKKSGRQPPAAIAENDRR